ncbi:MAG: hypothetical protein K0S49_62, partial [Microbacterium sp.]|nr:hypothetical protein [Microbacterium sp.]
REIASVISLARKGVSGKEDKRRDDIMAQRDHAIRMQEEAEAGERAADARADAAERARDAERNQRRIAQEELMQARLRLRENGIDPGPWPDFDRTDNPNRP